MAQNGLSWAEAVSQQVDPGLPHGWRETNSLSHQCGLPGPALAGSFSEEQELGLNRRSSSVGCACPSLSYDELLFIYSWLREFMANTFH